MRPEVHAAALRSAAKLVLGMASFSAVTIACASPTTDDTSSNSNAVTTNNDSTDNSGSTDTKPTPAPVSAACKATLESAFPGHDDYQYKPVPQSSDVVACCDEELGADNGMSPHRWACCTAFDPAATPDGGEPITGMTTHPWACTPWGPPVPPARRRSRKVSPARRDMNAFLIAQAMVA